ncbi:MAG TPA: 2,3-bisphosphoglycerate-independent phosphoglycerate mutase [Gammaproteobacteria bacterium]|nr:2,3-bisphosphoglycerate-independent phosphoglycerate mutase [Gammaproteobacteria bacterium]
MSGSRPKPVVLLVLDGWGYREAPQDNAIYHASTPVWDHLWADYPHLLIRSSGTDVGLPSTQMGNSEVGHLNLGAGRVVYQEFSRISRAIKSGSFFTNTTLTAAVDCAVTAGKAVHVLGLLSPGGVHSHEDHIFAMLRLAVERGAKRVYLHAFLDGRDTPPKSAAASLEKAHALSSELGAARIASMVGRYYAMDRDHRWPRVQAAYDLLTLGEAAHRAPDALSGLKAAYARGETDEFVTPTAIVPPGTTPVSIEDGDAVVFMNYRSDRARQITRAFTEDAFQGFARKRRPRLGGFATLTEYSREFNVPVAFPPERLRNVFGEYIAKLGLRQLRIAETEKYAHVTFFFNGGVEDPFPGEERILVPSPDVATYDLQPAMNAPLLTEKLVDAIKSHRFDAIICNYANPDMVGHTGNFSAAVQAIEAVDRCVGQVVAAIREAGGEALITADHGNAEQMRDPATHQAHTAHTCNPVPLVYVGRPAPAAASGSLSDVAPTLLHLMGLDVPTEMNGRPLLAPGGNGLA